MAQLTNAELVANMTPYFIKRGESVDTLVTDRAVIAGDGLTGGGVLTADVTLNLGTIANSGLDVLADSVAILLQATSGLALAASGLAMGTPGTLAVNTTDDVTASSHTHAITSSVGTDVSGASILLSTDTSGYLRVDRLGIGVAPSYPIHIRSTTTPQIQIEYDDTYWGLLETQNDGDLRIDAYKNVRLTPDGDIIMIPGGTDVIITGQLGVNVNAAVSFHVLSASAPQARIAYDADNYVSFAVASDGDTTITTATDLSAGSLYLSPVGDIYLDPTGDDVFPGTPYTINLGALSNKYLTLHAAELWVETLVAQDTIATIGGRILVGPTTILEIDINASVTYVTVKHNQMVRGDIAYMETNGNVEFLIVEALDIIESSGSAKTFRIAGDHTALFLSGGNFLVADSLANDGWFSISVNSTYFGGFTIITTTDTVSNSDDGHILIAAPSTTVGPFTYVSIIRDLDGTGGNSWAAGDAIFNTGQGGSGFADIYSYSGVLSSTVGPTITGNIRNTPIDLILNGGFETAGAGPPVFQDWAETVGDGAITQTATSHAGTYGARLDAGVTFNTEINQTIAVTGDTWYRLAFWALGDGTDSGEYGVYDETNTSWIQTRTTFYVEELAWAQRFLYFQTNPTTASLTVYFYCSSTNGAVTILDEAELVKYLHNDWSEHWAIGNLNGVYGESTDIYGVGLGRYGTGYNYMVVTDVNGIEFFDSAGVRIGQLTGTEWRLGQVGADNVYITTSGVQLMDNSIVRIDLQTDGDVFIGTDISDPTLTYVSVFAGAQTYNSESMAAGDMLIGDNSSSKANILWDKSAGQLLFRGGQNTKAFIDTSGAITAGNGDVLIDDEGFSIYGSADLFSFRETATKIVAYIGYINDDDYEVLRLFRGDTTVTNLIVNSSFETDLTGWTETGDMDTPTRSTNQSKCDSYSAYINQTELGPLEIGTWETSSYMALTGDAARFGVWLYRDSIAAIPTMWLKWYNSGSSLVKTTSKTLTLTEDAWIFHELLSTNPGTGVKVKVGFDWVSQTPYETEQLYIDCVIVQEITSDMCYIDIMTATNPQINMSASLVNITGKLDVGGDVELGDDILAAGGAFFGFGSISPTDIQIVVDQSAYDNAILSLRSSSDVNHNMTTIFDSEYAFGNLGKIDGDYGGLTIRGASDSASLAVGIELYGALPPSTVDTTKSTSGLGIITINTAERISGGPSIGTVAADGNLLVIQDFGTTHFIFEETGEMWINTDATGTEAHANLFDEYDDIALLAGVQASVLPARHSFKDDFADFIQYARPILEKHRVIEYNDDPGQDGRSFVGLRALHMLEIGAIRQLYDHMTLYENALLNAGIDIPQLPIYNNLHN